MFNHRQIFFDKKHNQCTFMRIGCDRGSMCYSVSILLAKAIRYRLFYTTLLLVRYYILNTNGLFIKSYMKMVQKLILIQ